MSLIGGQSRQAMGALIGIGLTLWAAQRIRMAYRRRDLRAAAIMIGLATGFAAHLAGGAPGAIAVILGFFAGYGAHLLYGDLLGAAPIEEEPVKEVPEEVIPAIDEPPFVKEARAKLVRAQHTAIAMADPNLTRAVEALSHVLDDLARSPQHIGEARRFVVVQLDGLSRIAERLDNGATPPATLYSLLDEMAGAAEGLRARLKARESEALAIQVKVLQERLRQEGYGPGTGSHTAKEQ
ncbi:hypothetical protein IAI18_16525 [Acetobacteraceae bacterium H6797]|nr:hypothetical protein [Acetobacteraceae bacterium H6797]